MEQVSSRELHEGMTEILAKRCTFKSTSLGVKSVFGIKARRSESDCSGFQNHRDGGSDACHFIIFANFSVTHSNGTNRC